MRYFSITLAFIGLFIGNIAVFSANVVSLRDKIAQMLIIGFDGKSADDESEIVKTIQKHNIGGVILFDYNQKTKQFDKNIESPFQVQQLTSNLQQANLNAELQHNRPKLPLLISVDYEGGVRGTRLNPSQGFPETQSAVKIADMPIADRIRVADTMANTLTNAGFNLNFAPVLDVNVNPDSPIIGKVGRSFSADPNTVSFDAHIFALAYSAHHILCAYKHFPGHGSATGDSHLGFVDVSETWQPKELEPYIQLFDQKTSCGMVMTAHLVNRQLDETGLPATLSHEILTHLLRKKLHFKGVVITDDMQMKAITAQYPLDKAVVLAINAGADMLMFGNQLTDEPQDTDALISLIESKVQSGEISETRIQNAYRRIVALKRTL